jgi:hypothetical protein
MSLLVMAFSFVESVSDDDLEEIVRMKMRIFAPVALFLGHKSVSHTVYILEK